MNNISLIFLVAFLCALVGCSTTARMALGTGDLSVGTKELNNPDQKFPIHGNFCGPGIPDIKSIDMDERIQRLTKISSIDILDETCKQHDICYVRNGYKNYKCDSSFLSSLYKYKSNNDSCNRLASLMKLYFESSNPIKNNMVNGNPINYSVLLAVRGSEVIINSLPSTDGSYSYLPNRYFQCGK